MARHGMIPSGQVDKDIRQDGARTVARRALGRVASARSRAGEKGSGLGCGIALALLGATLWGVNGTLSKVLMGRYGVEPLWFACVRELAQPPQGRAA